MSDQDRKTEIIDQDRAGEDDEDDVAGGYGKSHTKTTELRVDGGAAQNDWLLDFQSGLLGVPVRRPDVVETTALGAAGLAGLAVGIWPSAEDFLASQGEATRFNSSMSGTERATLLAGWAEAVRAVKGLAEVGRGT